jgi:hypothetical protein
MSESSPRRLPFIMKLSRLKTALFRDGPRGTKPQVFFGKPTEYEYATCVASAAVEAHTR